MVFGVLRNRDTLKCPRETAGNRREVLSALRLRSLRARRVITVGTLYHSQYSTVHWPLVY